MDADTSFRCWLEMKYQRSHWLDAIPLIVDELKKSAELKVADRDELLNLLAAFESSNVHQRETIATRMLDILVRYPAFEAEYIDFCTRTLRSEPDDRRDG